MYSANIIDTNKPEFYRELCAQLTALLAVRAIQLPTPPTRPRLCFK